ncbi:MAG: hypothetical protein DHS20C21_00780 [Gemmatimonadota bacterium]|nr:MAG: hypothetical protein DHS20C21_00780 [Gemmatimonadota bacterium]
MRRTRTARWFVGALAGMATLIATTGSYCGGSGSSATDQTVMIQVMDSADARVVGVEVTAWIVDTDDTTNRAPIVVGTALTDGEGTVEFTYLAATQPYVCGYEVREPTALTVLAESAATVSNHLSSPSGLVTVVLP